MPQPNSKINRHGTPGQPPLPAPPQRFAFLDSYRFLAIVMVIGIHSFAYVQLDPGSESVLRFLVQAIAVQIFFLVDGFLFADKQARENHFHYWPYIRRSSRRLLMSWFVFSLAYAGLRFAAEMAGIVDDRLVYGLPFGQALGHVYASIVAPQLYFLLSLFLIRCLAFLTRRLVSISLPVLAVGFGLYGAIYWNVDLRPYFLPGQDPVLHAFWGLQYYLFGILAWRLRHLLDKRAWAITFIALGLTFSIRLLAAYYAISHEGLIRAGGFFSQYGYLAGTFCLFYKIASKPSIFSRCGRYTMGIYLLHAPVVLKLSALLIATTADRRLAGYFALVGVSFILSLGLTYLLRSLPLGRLLLGEKISKPATMQSA